MLDEGYPPAVRPSRTLFTWWSKWPNPTGVPLKNKGKTTNTKKLKKNHGFERSVIFELTIFILFTDHSSLVRLLHSRTTILCTSILCKFEHTNYIYLVYKSEGGRVQRPFSYRSLSIR